MKNSNQWLGLAIKIAVFLVIIVLAWATVRGDVEENTEDIEKHDVRLTTVEKTTVEIDKKLVRIDTRQEALIKGVEQIKTKLGVFEPIE